MAKKKVIIIGGGLAGLSAAMRAAEKGLCVKLISLSPSKRSHSACAQGGINAAFNFKKEGDSPLIHAYETIKGGDFLADQPPVVEMCLAAPKIIKMMQRLGCPFNRTKEGNLDVRRFGGSLFHRTVFCGASTGQQLLYSLDEQVRRYEKEGSIERYEHHEFLRLIQDDEGRACGIVMMDLFTLELSVLQADAVLVATGGLGLLFGKSTNSLVCTGAANARLYMQGMEYANAEFVQIHPTAIPGEDKLRLMSESARGEGGRIWVPGDSSKMMERPDGTKVQCGETGKPWYFLEELYPAYGNLVPRDIAARELLNVCKLGLGVEQKNQVYLDLTHLPEETHRKLEAILEMYTKFTGDDPRAVPMRIYPAIHYTMGGAWVDYPATEDKDRLDRFKQMTSIRGCFNAGESDYLYHGANRLGANALLSCLFGGLVAAGEIQRYVESCKEREIDESIFDKALTLEEEKKREILARDGEENVHLLHEELSTLMMQHASVERNNEDLQHTIQEIKALRERLKNISLSDKGDFCNQTYIFANQFGPMLELALCIVKSAYLRNESRGSHYKEACKERDDEKFLKHTIASFDPDEPIISYRPVDVRYLKPEQRNYATAQTKKPEFKGLPENIELPV